MSWGGETMRRILFIATGAACAFIILGGLYTAVAQQGGQPMARIGFLSGEERPTSSDWKQRSRFYQGLADWGWRDGTNLSVEWRWADGQLDRLPALAAELVQLKPDVVVAAAFRPGQAAAQA